MAEPEILRAVASLSGIDGRTMASFVMQIAGVPISVHHKYDYIKNLCKNYMVDLPADFEVFATDEQIQAEMIQAEEYLKGEPFSPASCESVCLHREITKKLLRYGIILIHSAAIEVDGEAYVFLAKSGVGKSTHIRLWREALGGKVGIVNGDKPMFSFVGDRLYVHGAPWRGKEGWGRNISVPVKALCLLGRGEENEIHRASDGEVVSKLFHQVLLPREEGELRDFMNLVNRIIKEVPIYSLKCNISTDAALLAYNKMSKETEK